MLWVSGEIRRRPGAIRWQLGNAGGRAHEGRRHTRAARSRADAGSRRSCPHASAGPPSYARIIDQHRAVVDPGAGRDGRSRGHAGRSGCCSARWASCSSSRAPTWPTCSWCAPRAGAGPGDPSRDRRQPRAARAAADGRSVRRGACRRRARGRAEQGDVAAVHPRRAGRDPAACRGGWTCRRWVRHSGSWSWWRWPAARCRRCARRRRTSPACARAAVGRPDGRRWGRDMLVVAQTALALVLLIGSALLVQSFQKLRSGSGVRHRGHLHLPVRARPAAAPRRPVSSGGCT